MIASVIDQTSDDRTNMVLVVRRFEFRPRYRLASVNQFHGQHHALHTHAFRQVYGNRATGATPASMAVTIQTETLPGEGRPYSGMGDNNSAASRRERGRVR